MKKRGSQPRIDTNVRKTPKQIPIEGYKPQEIDDFEDMLREQKIQEARKQKEKQMQDNYEEYVREEKSKIVQDYMKKNKHAEVAYDYNGNMMVAQKQPLHGKNQNANVNQVNVGFKISETQEKPKKQQQQQSQKIDYLQKQRNKRKPSPKPVSGPEVQETKKQNKDQLNLESQQNAPSSYQQMIQNIVPSKGVKLIGHSGDIKSNNEITNENNPNQKKRMTKKEYQQMVENGQQYVRPLQPIQKSDPYESQRSAKSSIQKISYQPQQQTYNYQPPQTYKPEPIEYQSQDQTIISQQEKDEVIEKKYDQLKYQQQQTQKAKNKQGSIIVANERALSLLLD